MFEELRLANYQELGLEGLWSFFFFLRNYYTSAYCVFSKTE